MSTLQKHLVSAHFGTVLGVAAEAVAWRATGPMSGAGPCQAKKPAKAPLFCPTDGYQLSPSGVCFECA